MDLQHMRFPRALESAGVAETVRVALLVRTAKLWPAGEFLVPVLAMSQPLAEALRRERLMGRVRLGWEAVSDRLERERRGIDLVRERDNIPQGERISRLLLFSNDGAERLYRHLEALLTAQAPRLLGCLLETDGQGLGQLIVGRASSVKLVMVEHKDGVCDVLRALVAG